MNKIETKYFKRLLKEIGIYSTWIRERKRHLVERKELYYINNENIFENLKNNFSAALFSSFTWCDTKNAVMWSILHSEKIAENTPQDILNDEKKIRKLKRIVKNNK